MKNLNYVSTFLMTLVSVSAFATPANKVAGQTPYGPNSKSNPLSEKNLMAELTGKKVLNIPAAGDIKKAPLAVQHFYAGQRAAAQKNYILAIKHYNTVIQKYPKAPEAARSLAAKAQVYQEMGLQPQAERNLKLAQIQKITNSKALAQTQNKNKTIK